MYGADSVEVIQNILYPIAVAGLAQTIDCNNPEVTLDGSGSQNGPTIVYNWEGPGVINPTSSSPLANANQPGIYIISVEDVDNGCMNIDSVIVDQNTTIPNIEIATPEMLDCTIDEVSLDGSGSSTGSSFTHNWIKQPRRNPYKCIKYQCSNCWDLLPCGSGHSKWLFRYRKH